MFRAIIVDDEELSVKRLKRILAESGEVMSCHDFLNPLEAYEFAKRNPIDIAFLDISMAEINGMTLAGLLDELDSSIEVVFVTGYDEYAVQAFEVNALDYLLKPVTAQRVAKTLGKLKKRNGSPAIRPTLAVQLFDGFRIYRPDRDQKPIKLRSPKTEELFAFLVCKRSVSREEIIDTLWSGLAPDKAWKNLNSTLYYIRKALSEAGMDKCLHADRNGIRIVENGLYCDLFEFERLLKLILRTTAENTDLFKQAESLYSGPLLKGRAYEWIGEKTRRLEQDYTKVLELAARFYLERNETQEALHYFGEIIKLDALREDISHEIISLYIKLGRTNEALRHYRMLEQLLQRELGVKPGPELQNLIGKMNQ
ncbi:BTAD domain-containing putative transcriptional regulator [Paenibacillus sp. M1]|uniref:BTAD domain-containing putative transcriptional regulator n=1 Tax=Paenibacillus haidiansis TaxID=1574488 RepID=A0ABU7VYY6_9BACL